MAAPSLRTLSRQPPNALSAMAIRLRFAMHGIRNHRILHLVAIDHRKARNAKPAELLGVFKPCIEGPQGKKSLEWSVDRIRYWLHVGAVPSKSVVGLLELGGILEPGSPYHPKTTGQKLVEAPKSPPAKSTTKTKPSSTSQRS